MVIVKYSFPGDLILRVRSGNGVGGFYQESHQFIQPNFYPNVTSTSSMTVYKNENRHQPTSTPTVTFCNEVEFPTSMGASATTAYSSTGCKTPLSRITYHDAGLLHHLPKDNSSQRNKNKNAGKIYRIILRNQCENKEQHCLPSQLHETRSEESEAFSKHPEVERDYVDCNDEMGARSRKSPTEVIHFLVNISHNDSSKRKINLCETKLKDKEKINDVNGIISINNGTGDHSNISSSQCLIGQMCQGTSYDANLLEYPNQSVKEINCAKKIQKAVSRHERDSFARDSSLNHKSVCHLSMCSNVPSFDDEFENIHHPISVDYTSKLEKNINLFDATENLVATSTETLQLQPHYEKSHSSQNKLLFQDVELSAANPTLSGSKDVFDFHQFRNDKTSKLSSSSDKINQIINICPNHLMNDTWKSKKRGKNSSQKRGRLNFARNISTDMFPFITKENVFEVQLEKDSRGLGLSICGGRNLDPQNPIAQLIRIKRLFPLQAALNCGKLKIGDIILAVNDRYLTGLSYTEAIEILRMAPAHVNLIICRPEEGVLPPIPEDSKALNGSFLDGTSESATKFTGPQYEEFDVTLTKIGGSLGFTIVKSEKPNDGHYIKALVKEPALSNGNLQPGDKIVLVNGTDISEMSHAEIIGFLRSVPPEVTLCLWREVAPATSPLSPASPILQEPFFGEPKLKRTKPLRKEALDMLSDKARLKGEKRIEGLALGCSASPLKIGCKLKDPPPPAISIDLAKKSSASERKFSEDAFHQVRDIACNEACVPSPSSSGIASSLLSTVHNVGSYSETESSGFGGEESLGSAKDRSNLISIGDSSKNADDESSQISRSISPYKPQRPSFLDLSSENLSPRKQMYGRNFITLHEKTSDNSDSSFQYLDSSDSLPFSDDPLTTVTSSESSPFQSTNQSALIKWRGATLNTDENLLSPEELEQPQFQKPSVLTVDLERRWNSRLGFSLVTLETSRASGIYIKLIYPGSLAAVDGRLQVGDKLIKVNGNLVSETSITEVINLLRKSQGKISLTVERLPDNFLAQVADSSNTNVTLSRSQSQHQELLSNEISNLNVKNNNVTRHFHLDSRQIQLDNRNENCSSFTNLRMHT